MAKFKIERIQRKSIAVEAETMVKALDLESEYRLAADELGERYSGPRYEVEDEIVQIEEIGGDDGETIPDQQ